MARYRYITNKKEPTIGRVLLTVQEDDKIFQLADGTGPRGGKRYFLLWGSGTDLNLIPIETAKGNTVRSQSVATHYLWSAVRAARSMRFSKRTN